MFIQAVTGGIPFTEPAQAWIPLAIMAAATAASVLSARSTNKKNKQIADEQNVFNERMSNTSHAREMQDLKNSGLNPILAANGGASTPQAAGATMQNPMADVPDIAAKSISNSTAKQQADQQGRATESAIGVNETQKDVNKAMETKALSDAMASQQSAKRSEMETRLLNTQYGEAEARAKFIKENPWMIQAKEYSSLLGQSLGNVTSGANLWNLIKKPTSTSESTIFNQNSGEILRERKTTTRGR